MFHKYSGVYRWNASSWYFTTLLWSHLKFRDPQVTESCILAIKLTWCYYKISVIWYTLFTMVEILFFTDRCICILFCCLFWPCVFHWYSGRLFILSCLFVRLCFLFFCFHGDKKTQDSSTCLKDILSVFWHILLPWPQYNEYSEEVRCNHGKWGLILAQRVLQILHPQLNLCGNTLRKQMNLAPLVWGLSLCINSVQAGNWKWYKVGVSASCAERKPVKD